MSEIDWSELLSALAEPFLEQDIQWRAGPVSRDKKKAQALPYAEPRIYEDRLNRVCPGNWECHFIPWDKRLICEVTIHGVTRASTGEENDGGFAPGTSTEAQAFKRACSKFGLGRYLYDIVTEWVEYDDERKRLIRTPRLSKEFLPQPRGAKASQTTPTAKQEAAANTVKTNAFTVQRAMAMKDKLRELGYTEKEIYSLATTQVGRNITDLSDLTGEEAAEVWAYAKQGGRNVGK